MFSHIGTSHFLSPEKERIRIRVIYLMSRTQGVVSQSPWPGAHDTWFGTSLVL